MHELLRHYFNIAFLMGKPQDLPSGDAQMKVGIALAFVTYIMAVAVPYGVALAAMQALLDLPERVLLFGWHSGKPGACLDLLKHLAAYAVPLLLSIWLACLSICLEVRQAQQMRPMLTCLLNSSCWFGDCLCWHMSSDIHLKCA